ncbi:transposase [Actinomyces bowdenii]|uniref:Transposase n=1 Tax=Actinomyces bowdenii TaxID=131109 RepID=A0A3P1UN91_9ACTO|nr:transposase [Actinomyces bowdenii]MBF0695973.1 transposase [Actinomyces bowdenii]NYS68146.1 transposase [Actinomyces bowdenii]RRD22967.1 hypothetical protein EII10_12265 [Actinomyces bowdenii]
MSKAKYSEEFKEQVVREVIDKERSIASVAVSYDLVFQRRRQLGREVQEGARQCRGAGGSG